MKKLFVLLLTVPLLLGSTKPNEVEHDFYGIWRTIDNDFIQISTNQDFQVVFRRIDKTRMLVSKGEILTAGDGTIKVQRDYPKNETYISDYVFSPSKKTLVIMKPNNEQAWVLERISN